MKPRRSGLGRDHALPGQEQRVGHLAQQQLSAKPGVGMNAGRCMARPSARANSALVTGSGAVALSGPDDRRRLDRAAHEPIQSSR